MKSLPLVLFALSACAPVQCTPPDGWPAETPGAARQSAGRVVTEIDSRIWCIHQDQRGTYWFGSNGNGVYCYDGRRITNYTGADGLSGDHVRSIEEDTNGNVFISTTAGVTTFDGVDWTRLDLVEAPPHNEGWVLDPDDVWLVLDPGSGGPCRYDGENLYRLTLTKSPAEDAHRIKFPNVDFPASGVYSIYKDDSGHVWFGTAAVGLCRFDGETLSWLYEERLTTTPTGGAFGIRSIFQDRAGDFWICNTRQRFAISPDVAPKDGFSLVEYETKEGVPDAQMDSDSNFTYYPSMTEDDEGVLWMACGHDGVWSFDGETVTRFPVGQNAYAMCLERDHDNRIWVGTLQQGAYTFDGTRFERFPPRDPER